MADIKSISLRPLLFFAWRKEPDGLWWWLSILPEKADWPNRNVPYGWLTVERVPCWFLGKAFYNWRKS